MDNWQDKLKPRTAFTHTLQVRLERGQMERLKKLAAHYGVSVAELLRTLADAALEDFDNKHK